MSLFAELKRRNVIRVAAAYGVLSWLVLQIADTLSDTLTLPDWTGKMVLMLLAIGLIPTLVFSWIYELTPEGVKKESEIDRETSITAHTARKLDVAVIILFVFSLGLFAYDRFLRSPVPGSDPISAGNSALTPATQSSLTTPSAIAVLPFTDLSPAGDQGYFADGIAEEILNLLARSPGLRVIARTSAFKFRGESHDLREVGKLLNANRILEGSVRTAGSRVRITAQLIDSDTNLHLWSETYDREMTDIFALQDEIAAAITKALGVHLDMVQKTTQGGQLQDTADVDAYHLYLRGKQALAERGTGRLGDAIELLGQSAEAAPDQDIAFGTLTLAHALSVLYLRVPAEQAIANAVASSDRALTLNENNVDALVGRAYALAILGLRIAEGEALFQRALELRPNDVAANNLTGDLYRLLGDRDLALRYERKAIELDPLSAIHQWDLAQSLMEDGDWEQVLVHARRATALSPDNRISITLEIVGHVFLGQLDAAEKRLDEALASSLLRTTRSRTTALLIAIAQGDPAVIEIRRKQALAVIESSDNRSRGLASLARLSGDLESTAKYVQAVMDAGDTAYWINSRFSFGLLEEFSEAGIHLNFPPEVRELMARRQDSPWSSTQRLYADLIALRDGEQGQ